MKFQLAIDRCPRSVVPFVSLTCAGDFCHRFFRPCTQLGSSAECGDQGLSCQPPLQPWVNETAGRSMESLVSELLTLVKAIGSEEELGHCGEGSLSGAATITKKIRDFAFKAFGLSAPADATNVNFGFCMPTKVRRCPPRRGTQLP